MVQSDRDMSASALVELLVLIEATGIEVWLDGGWGVDALIGKQSRPHKDVDILVRVADVARLEAILASRGVATRRGSPPDSFVLRDDLGLEVDVHAVVFDSHGNGLYRMETGEIWVYPAEGFTGRGVVDGRAFAASHRLCRSFVTRMAKCRLRRTCVTCFCLRSGSVSSCRQT